MTTLVYENTRRIGVDIEVFVALRASGDSELVKLRLLTGGQCVSIELTPEEFRTMAEATAAELTCRSEGRR